jgi:hypothetical protein
MKKLFIALMIAFTAISSFAAETIDVSNETFPYTYSGKWKESNYCMKIPDGNNQYSYMSTFKIKLDRNDTLKVTYTGDDSYTQNIMIIGTSSVMSRSGSFISTKDNNEVLIYVSSDINTDTLSLQTSYNLRFDLARAVTSGLPINMSKSSNFIATAGGSILIQNTQARATIYNIGGAKVYEGADREIALPGGIYVVRIGEMAKKVIVK